MEQGDPGRDFLGLVLLALSAVAGAVATWVKGRFWVRASTRVDQEHGDAHSTYRQVINDLKLLIAEQKSEIERLRVMLREAEERAVRFENRVAQLERMYGNNITGGSP